MPLVPKLRLGTRGTGGNLIGLFGSSLLALLWLIQPVSLMAEQNDPFAPQNQAASKSAAANRNDLRYYRVALVRHSMRKHARFAPPTADVRQSSQISLTTSGYDTYLPDSSGAELNVKTKGRIRPRLRKGNRLEWESSPQHCGSNSMVESQPSKFK